LSPRIVAQYRQARRVRIGFSQDPGQAGRARHFIWCGFTVSPAPQSGDNLTRFGPLRSPCRAGNVKILRGAWNEELFRILEGFPDLAMTTRSMPAAEP